MKVSFMGIGQQVATFISSSAAENKVCRISANGTVAPCSAGNAFAGVVLHVRDGYADVQLKGYATVGYTGSTAPAVGYSNLVADGSGGVKVDSSGRSYLVAEVDTTANTVGLFL